LVQRRDDFSLANVLDAIIKRESPIVASTVEVRTNTAVEDKHDQSTVEVEDDDNDNDVDDEDGEEDIKDIEKRGRVYGGTSHGRRGRVYGGTSHGKRGRVYGGTSHGKRSRIQRALGAIFG
jgi:hypothetical protein